MVLVLIQDGVKLLMGQLGSLVRLDTQGDRLVLRRSTFVCPSPFPKRRSAKEEEELPLRDGRPVP